MAGMVDPAAGNRRTDLRFRDDGSQDQSDSRSQSEFVKLTVALCPARLYADISVKVTVPTKVLVDETCSPSPETPWIHETTFEAVEIADQPITLIVRDVLGRVILENTQDRDPSQ